MALCENVYRRGGVYWWRRRLSLGDDASCSYIRISLKVRDPRHARELARRVGVEADRLVEMRMLTASEQKQLLRAFIDHQAGHYEGIAGLVAHQDAERGVGEQAVAERTKLERAMGAAYAALASRGVAAEIGEREASALALSGFEAAEIDQIRAKVAYYRECLPRLAPDGTISAEGPNGLIGPTNRDLRQMLGLLDADATNDNVDLARRLWLQATAVVLNDADRRHSALGLGQAEAIFGEMFGQPAQVLRTTPARKTPIKPGVDLTISGQIAAMNDTKKGQEWKVTKRGKQDVSDSAESYIFLGRILIKMLAADDLRKIDAETPMQLRQQLQSLPLNYGKAPKDWDVSFDEAIARAKAAKKPIGRGGATINKYLNFLQAFLNFLEGSGVVVPDIWKQIKKAKVKVPKKKGSEMRGSFSDDDYKALFSDDEWCGAEVVHDSTYWVPLFTRYGGGRLEEPCGLMIEEIDFESPIPSYHIQDNEMRTIKSEERRVPFHDELLRLGIREYVDAIKARGFRELFPDFRARGERTAIGTLFDKKFTPILDRALPTARSNKKTQHSNRKTLNTELRNNAVDITVRCELLGHSQESVNAIHYTDKARDLLKKAALDTIANVTGHVPARPIRLSPLLSRYPKSGPE